MRKLTENQKLFLFEYCFKNDKYPGWRNITLLLLETGKCIVPGNECIWHGGIGNFIKTSEAKDAYGCLLYTFDLEYFLTSKWYNEIREKVIEVLNDEIKIKLSKKEDICNLFNV